MSTFLTSLHAYLMLQLYKNHRGKQDQFFVRFAQCVSHVSVSFHNTAIFSSHVYTYFTYHSGYNPRNEKEHTTGTRTVLSCLLAIHGTSTVSPPQWPSFVLPARVPPSTTHLSYVEPHYIPQPIPTLSLAGNLVGQSL